MENNSKGDERQQFSLSSAILAPLTSLVQAQVHNSRAFLNYLLQLGYRHANLDEKGNITTADNTELTPFTLPFVNKVQINGHEVLQRIEIPALALVPAVPLGIESAEFEYQFAIDRYTSHNPLQTKRQLAEQRAATGGNKNTSTSESARPWFLVEDPVNFQGKIGGGDTDESSGNTRQQSAIQIKIKVGQMPIPSGLDKLLTALTQSATAHIVPPDNTPPATAPQTKPQE